MMNKKITGKAKKYLGNISVELNNFASDLAAKHDPASVTAALAMVLLNQLSDDDEIKEATDIVYPDLIGLLGKFVCEGLEFIAKRLSNAQ